MLKCEQSKSSVVVSLEDQLLKLCPGCIFFFSADRALNLLVISPATLVTATMKVIDEFNNHLKMNEDECNNKVQTHWCSYLNCRVFLVDIKVISKHNSILILLNLRKYLTVGSN